MRGDETVHILCFRIANTYISAQKIELTELSYEVLDDHIIFTIPDTVRCDREKLNRFVPKKDSWIDALKGFSGASRAVQLDSYRAKEKTTFFDTEAMLSLLRENGHRIQKINERLFRIDDETKTLGDLTVLAKKYQNDIVLCM